MPKLFAVSIVLFLLLGAGYGAIQAARSIPWDCSDWQAFAHSDRTTAILESLAENRGKTLYCGIDQSDTFTKAETWQAGKDRNERDDTVYFGERGSFRGFIAAQEGWLTDGESGITGQSEASIFEFPREERRIRRTKRFTIAAAAGPDDGASCEQVGGVVCSGWAGHSGQHGGETSSLWNARRFAVGTNTTDRHIDWRTQARTNVFGGGSVADGFASPSTAEWLAMAETKATRACRARGGKSVSNVDFGPGHNGNQPSSGANHLGLGLGFYIERLPYPEANPNPSVYRHRARQSRTWTATCKKVIRRN